MNKKWFVFYDDDYPGNGGIGLSKFDSQQEAEEFIKSRMAERDKPDISNYTVIEGVQKNVVEISRVTEVRIADT